jgi:predicted anti-sigma-YlaC factor YlaD
VTQQQMGQACPGWRGDLAAYLVGALDSQACAAVRRHLGCCPACRAEYENLAPVVGRLALLTLARTRTVTWPVPLRADGRA